jgi:hypothetical protein
MVIKVRASLTHFQPRPIPKHPLSEASRHQGLTTVADEKHIARLKKGVKTWNAWRRTKAAPRSIDLSGADLRGANLDNVNLGGANLVRANLTKATLVESFLGEPT